MCDGAPVVALVPGDRKADTGKVARLTGARRAAVASAAEVVEATGFRPGGVAPFPLEGVSAVLVDRTLLRHRMVWAGAGSEQHVVGLSPNELVRLSRGRVEDLVLESP
jgi:Cys-tRNA(Pro)/Cys-tRNA(Cys) deacylase